MITLRDVHKSFGAQTLFDGASLQINYGDRLALVGPNGAGKSTLFRLILGEETPDDGQVVTREGVRIGYLPQETPALSGRSALQETLGDETADPRREAEAKKVLMGLGFRLADFDRPVSAFSGGWQMRVMIARLLLEAPDLLMLDEPTNHLDLESLLWFQNHLRAFRGSLFVISHDRELINAVTDKIVEAKDGRLAIYHGSYEDFVEQKAQEKEALIAAHKRQQKEIKDLETFINRFRAKASLASSVQSKIKYLERMEKIELPPEDQTIGFSFPQPARSGVIAMELKGVRMSYDGATNVYDGLDLIIERGEKIALVGPNGAGKSTLLKLLAGVVPYQAGERKEGHNVEVGYFSQHRMQQFASGRTVFQTAADTRRAHSETTIRTVLGSFLFRGDAVYKTVDVLSGGEKSRLGLARLLLDPPNVLLLDEPTTHLDMASVEVLSDALRRFEGTVVLISHDVYFIRRLANHVIHVRDGVVTRYPGDYDYFLHRMAAMESEEAELFRAEEEIEAKTHGRKKSAPPSPAGQSAGPPADSPLSFADAIPGPDAPAAPLLKTGGPKSKEQKRREAEERKEKNRKKREREKLQAEIDDLALREKEIMSAMARPDTHRDPKKVTDFMIELGQVQKRLKELKAG